MIILPTMRAALGGFNVRKIPTLALWLDASDAGTLWDSTTGGSLVAAGGLIARWEDKSGNSRHVTQATSGNRPARSASAINGRDAASFEADTARYMVGTDILHTQDVTVFVVEKSPTTGGGTTGRVLLQTSNAANGIGVSLKDSGTSNNRNIYARGVANGSAGAHTFGATTLVVANRNSASGGTRNLWINGSSVTVSTNTGAMTNPTAGIVIGRIDTGTTAYALQGTIAEILVFASTLSVANRQAVESYLTAKYF